MAPPTQRLVRIAGVISQVQTPRGDVTIRPVREAEAEAYRDLRLEGLRLHPGAFGADFESSSARPLAFWHERARQGAGGDEGVLYVADAAGALVGLTALIRNDLRKTRHGASIVGVYVRPEWRGLRIADALLHACINYAQRLGIRVLRLGVATDNLPAIRVYARCGFTVYGIEPESVQVDGVYQDELLMARRLVP